MRAGFEWDVELADGTVLHAECDQRDTAMWEVQDVYSETRYTLRARFTAWSALRRQGEYNKPFETFNTTDCKEVRVPDDAAEDDGEGEQSPDPGQPASAATHSSTSRSRRASRSVTS